MTVIPLPRHGQWAWDLRGQGRGIRVSAHVDEGLLNVSLWREGTCVGTAQLLPADVAKLVSGLSEGLAEIAVQRPLHAVDPHAPERIRELKQRLADVETRLAHPPAARFPGVVRAFRALQHPRGRRNTHTAGDDGQSASSGERARIVATVPQTVAATSTPPPTSSRFRP
jgi:hypothetical protein